MMRYEEPNMEIIIIRERADVITLSVIENEQTNGEQWWGNN